MGGERIVDGGVLVNLSLISPPLGDVLDLADHVEGRPSPPSLTQEALTETRTMPPSARM